MNECSCELLPDQHIWPLYYSRFLHVMVQCTLDVVRVCCIDWNVKLFTHCPLHYCGIWRSSCQNSDVLMTFVFIYWSIIDSITILSLNCQGLGNARKRRDVFQYLKQKSCSIYCLQDTHFSTKLEAYIKAEWNWTSIASLHHTALIQEE